MQRCAIELGLSEKRLRSFRAVLETGSIRGAADALNAEPSVISRQIRSLEDDLRVALFERRGRGVVPTEFAQLVLEHHRTCTSSLDTLFARLEELKGIQTGVIHIVAGEGFANDLIDTAMNQFCREFPNVSVSLELASVVDVLSAIAEDRAHIGIAYGAAVDVRFATVADKHHPVCVAVTPDHPLAQAQAPLRLSEVGEHPIALMPQQYGLGQLAKLAQFSESVRLTPSLVTNSISALKHYARTGHGSTLLPFMTLDEEVRNGTLVAVRTSCAVLEDARARLLLREGRIQLPVVSALAMRLAKTTSLR